MPKKDKRKSSTSRNFVVHDRRTPGIKSYHTQHDLDALIREELGWEEKPPGPPAEVVPLKRPVKT